MTKGLVIFSLLLFSAYADILLNALNELHRQNTGEPSLFKRQTNPQCSKYQCLTAGSTCSSNACSNCQTQYSPCISNAFGNNTALCSCFNQYFACLQQYPICAQDQYSATLLCDAYVQPGTCNCGNAPNVYPTCYMDTSYCDIGNTNKCVLKHASGNCTGPNSLECADPNAFVYSSLPYNCQNTTKGYQCTKQSQTQFPGDPCTTSSDCINNLPCTGGVCQGIASGSQCNDGDCAFGLVCDPNNGTCVPATPLGGSCTQNPGGCSEELTCGYASPNTSKCVSVLSVAAGQPCNLNSNECQAGTNCNATQSQPKGVCIAVLTSNIPCNNDTDCNQYGVTCSCNFSGNKVCGGGTPPTVPSGCVSTYMGALSCLTNHQCVGTGANSCGTINCGSQLNCTYNCVLGDPLYSSYFAYACYQNIQPPYCATGTTHAASTSPTNVASTSPTNVASTSQNTAASNAASTASNNTATPATTATTKPNNASSIIISWLMMAIISMLLL